MSLSADFQFSQASLQDYVDCQRRFQLRYVRRLRWPAVEAEPAIERERHLRQGAFFHRLIYQHLTGMSVDSVSRTVNNPELRRWWRNYLESRPEDLPSRRYPELGLSAPLSHVRLLAQYDLVAVDVGERAVIVDWKTSRRRPSREWLLDRLQTRVYPYLVVRAGASLNDGDPIRPEQVTMVYWFANAPTVPESLSYDLSAYRSDHRYLSRLIEEIQGRFEERSDDELLPRTDDETRCRYCRYRSLCRRGIEAGFLDQIKEGSMSEGDFDFELDFEQIAEAEYG